MEGVFHANGFAKKSIDSIGKPAYHRNETHSPAHRMVQPSLVSTGGQEIPARIRLGQKEPNSFCLDTAIGIAAEDEERWVRQDIARTRVDSWNPSRTYSP